MELYLQDIYVEKYDRELIKAEDGGTLGVDWAYDKDGKGRPSLNGNGQNKTKPILLMAPGMSGCRDRLYTLCLMWLARKKGYKVGTILFRGAEDLPYTSGKISYGGAWRDAKNVIDHVHKTYVKKEKQKG